MIMAQIDYGNVVVLYTFLKDGDEEKYKNKVTELKHLLPNKIHELEDQSSLLIQSNCDINELETKLKEKYTGNLEEKESVILVYIQSDCLTCISILPDSAEAELINAMDRLEQAKNTSDIAESVRLVVRKMQENTAKMFKNIINN